MSAALASGERKALLDEYDALLLDLDGVVHTGGMAVPHAVDVLAEVRRRGTPMAFVTNNASRTPEAVAAVLQGMGVDAEATEVATSAQAAARLLAARFPPDSPVLVVGGDGLVAALGASGLRPVTSVEEGPVAVAQGYHPDVGWRQLAEATLAVRAGAYWVATNLDLTIPSERGILPGNGTLVAAVATALGRQPDATAGKPAPPLHHESVLRTGGSAPLVVGDRLDTDIAGAAAVGADSLLVLTGVTAPADLVSAGKALRPTHVSADLRGLLQPGVEVQVTEGESRCGDWTAVADGHLVWLRGDGERVDALRAVLPLCWAQVDSSVTPAVEVPVVLASWWDSH